MFGMSLKVFAHHGNKLCPLRVTIFDFAQIQSVGKNCHSTLLLHGSFGMNAAPWKIIVLVIRLCNFVGRVYSYVD